MLLGCQITLADIVDVGVGDLAVILFAVVATFLFRAWAKFVTGLRRELAWLIAIGMSICGVAAIAAISSSIRSNAKDTAYAIACITLFDSIAMFTYSLVPALLDLSDAQYGLPLSIHGFHPLQRLHVRFLSRRRFYSH